MCESSLNLSQQSATHCDMSFFYYLYIVNIILAAAVEGIPNISSAANPSAYLERKISHSKSNLQYSTKKKQHCFVQNSYRNHRKFAYI